MGGDSWQADQGRLTTVANLRDGWVVGGVYIGRAGRGLDGYFGNPYPVGVGRDRNQSVAKYQDYFHRRMEGDIEFAGRVHDLRGRVLLCFCKPLLCHGDVIAGYLNG